MSPKELMNAFWLGVGAAVLLGGGLYACSDRSAAESESPLVAIRASAVESEVQRVAGVDGSALMLRAGPGVGFPVVGRLADGDEFKVSCWSHGSSVEGNRVWLRATPGERVGWVSSEFTESAGTADGARGVDLCGPPQP